MQLLKFSLISLQVFKANFAFPCYFRPLLSTSRRQLKIPKLIWGLGKAQERRMQICILDGALEN